MWKIAVVLALGAAGCITSRDVHSVWPVVKTIRAQPGGLAVESCVITHIRETSHECLTPILGLLALRPTSGGSSTTTWIEQGACTTAIIPTGDL
jgi:hypothetical protein